jgi:lysozyme family protein
MFTFDDALKFVLPHEGGFVDDPDDPGGRTNFGITQATYDSWLKDHGALHRSVEHISQFEVKCIYQKGYWDPVHAHYLAAPLALVMFDTAVNFGVEGAMEKLQAALGVPLTGTWTVATSEAVHKCDQAEVAQKICELRIQHRYARVKKKPSQAKFLHGWLNRDNDLAARARQLAQQT